METELFEIWELPQIIPNDLFFYSLEYSSDSLIILLKSFTHEDKILKIAFNGVLTYRVSQETAKSKTLYENPSLRGFRFSKDSEFIRWFQKESAGIFEGWDLSHYYICNTDNIIDVISGPPLIVEWV